MTQHAAYSARLRVGSARLRVGSARLCIGCTRLCAGFLDTNILVFATEALNTQCEWFRVAVEYRLKFVFYVNYILLIKFVFPFNKTLISLHRWSRRTWWSWTWRPPWTWWTSGSPWWPWTHWSQWNPWYVLAYLLCNYLSCNKNINITSRIYSQQHT